MTPPSHTGLIFCMRTSDERREAVEFLRTHRCADEAWGYDKTFVVGTLGIFALIAPIVFGCFAVDAITHLAVPQAAMINDMLEMVQNG